MQHLSACGDCREIVALALPASEERQYQVELAGARPGWNWLNAPVLRWGVVTAGVAILASVGFVHYRPGRSGATPPDLVAHSTPPKLETSESSRAPSGTPKAASAAASSVADKTMADEVEKAKSIRAEAKKALAVASGSDASRATSRGTVATQAQNSLETAQNQVTLQTEAAPPAVDYDSDRVVGKAKAPVAAETASAGKVNPSPAARSATELAMVSVGPSLAQWKVSPAGHVQRSFDQGKSWQDVDVRATPSAGPSDSSLTFRAVFAAGNEVWAGGSAGALFHSSDGGNSWARVIPSVAGVVLTADVTAVEFADSQRGKIKTSSSETWTTQDGGQSWQKQ